MAFCDSEGNLHRIIDFMQGFWLNLNDFLPTKSPDFDEYDICQIHDPCYFGVILQVTKAISWGRNKYENPSFTILRNGDMREGLKTACGMGLMLSLVCSC